jgi:methionine synthase I (cobalamin-dependent)
MSSIERLRETTAQRIVVLDRAMGTMVQALNLGDEDAWRAAAPGPPHRRPRLLRRPRADPPQAIEDVHHALKTR